MHQTVGLLRLSKLPAHSDSVCYEEVGRTKGLKFADGTQNVLWYTHGTSTIHSVNALDNKGL